jgi:DNA polymerase-1
MSKVLIADATNILMRAVYASRGREMSAAGVFTGGVVIVINTITRLVRDEQPDRLVMCWDGGRSTMRTALDPQYKANRRDQPEDLAESRRDTKGLSCEFFSLCGVHHVERPGVEADDLVAAYWRRHVADGDQVVIVSSDKDFLQLIGDRTEQIRLSSAGTPTDRWDVTRMRETYGCEPRHWPKVLALAGDASDNVPGVPRYGVKTAVKALAKAGWDINAIEDPRVTDLRDRVRLNHDLVNLRNVPPSPSPVPFFRPTIPGDALWGPLLDYLRLYRLETIKERLHHGSLWRNSSVTERAKINPVVH